MSINRAVLALGAVAVVGVATVGASTAYAVHAGKPVPNIAVVSGSSWTQFKPICYNAGKQLTAKQISACNAVVQKQLTSAKLKTVTISSASSTFGINVDQIAADRGWSADSQNGEFVSATKHAYAGPLQATPVLTTTSQSSGSSSVGSSAPVLVVESARTQTDQNAPIYGEWLFQLKVKDS
jgi:hypothetical protein